MYSKQMQLHKPRNHPHRKKRNKRSLATEITPSVRMEVKMRDGKCVFCGSIHNGTIAHYIPRSAGGLGIKENLAWACIHCHQKMDHTKERPKYLEIFKQYLDKIYPNFKDENRRFDKWKNLK